VLLGRIELPTSSLPMTRSTTELQQLSLVRAALCEAAWQMSTRLRARCAFGIASDMTEPAKKSREERLAEALRANLRRRKVGEPKLPSADLPETEGDVGQQHQKKDLPSDRSL
jgi:hypothetical protein